MSACSPLLMQMSAAGPLVPAAPSTFVDARARFEGALELRPGRNIECSFRPQEKDAKAPTVFLVPRGGSTAAEEFGAPFVAELAKTATVATMACDADADEAARDLYEFFKRYAGDSTNRTLTSINVLVARGSSVALAVRLTSRFTRNNVDAVVVVEPSLKPPRRWACLDAALGVVLPGGAKRRTFDRTARRLWPDAGAWRAMYQPTLVVAARPSAAVLAHLVDPSVAALDAAADPVGFAARVADHADAVLGAYSALRARASRGFVCDAAIDADVTAESLDRYAGVKLEA